MSFFNAIAKCYRKYFVFKGRASRSEFWWCYLAGFLCAWPLLLVETKERTWYTFLGLIYFMLTLSILIPLMSVWTRRMHDVGKSGWIWLVIMIPVLGPILLIRWASKEGSLEVNKYGEPDNQPYVQVKRTSEEE